MVPMTVANWRTEHQLVKSKVYNGSTHARRYSVVTVFCFSHFSTTRPLSISSAGGFFMRKSRITSQPETTSKVETTTNKAISVPIG